MNLNPQPVQSIHLRFYLSAQPFYMACNWACVNSSPLIVQPCTSLQSLLHLTTVPLDLTTIFAAHRHGLCCSSPRSLLHRTTVSAAPHHDLCCTSPQIHLHLNHKLTAATNSNLAYRHPTPALQKLVVISNI